MLSLSISIAMFSQVQGVALHRKFAVRGVVSGWAGIVGSELSARQVHRTPRTVQTGTHQSERAETTWLVMQTCKK